MQDLFTSYIQYENWRHDKLRTAAKKLLDKFSMNTDDPYQEVLKLFEKAYNLNVSNFDAFWKQAEQCNFNRNMYIENALIFFCSENNTFKMDQLVTHKLIDSYNYEFGRGQINTKAFGQLDFIKCSDFFKDELVLEKLKSDNLRQCHSRIQWLIKHLTNLKAIVMKIPDLIGNKLYHSCAIDENNNIIDFSHGFVMEKSSYDRLFSPEVICIIDSVQLEELKVAAFKHCSEQRFLPLLGVACYLQAKLNHKH